MATAPLLNCKLWFGGYDLSGDMNALALKVSAAEKPATAFGDAGIKRRSGLKSVMAQHRGYIDLAVGGVDDVLFGKLAVADEPMTAAPTDGTEGEIAYTFRALEGEYSPMGEVDEMFGFAVAAESSAGDPLVRGTVVLNGTKTVTGTGSIFNLGAVGATQKLYAALHVFGVTGGTPTLDVTVQSAALVGFGSPTTRITFAQAIARGSQWAAAVAGPITDGFWRVSYTISGSTPSFPFVVVVGIQ